MERTLMNTGMPDLEQFHLADSDEEVARPRPTRVGRLARAGRVVGLIALGAAVAMLAEHGGGRLLSTGSTPATIEAFPKMKPIFKRKGKNDEAAKDAEDTSDEEPKKKAKQAAKQEAKQAAKQEAKDEAEEKSKDEAEEKPKHKFFQKVHRKPFNPFKGMAAAAKNTKMNAMLMRAKSQYSESAVQAFAAMAKLSYCGNLPGIYAAVASSCSVVHLPNSSSVCERAKFTSTPGLVRVLHKTDMEVEDSLFGYVTKVEPMDNTSGVKSGVLIVLRGAIDNSANSVRDNQTRMEEGPHGCEGCSVHQGYHQSYYALEHQLERNLQELSCLPGECTIYVTGHGTGAAMASMFAWELSENNYTIGTSYIFETPQVGDAKFAEEMTNRFNGHGEHGAIFSIAHGKDSMPRSPFNATFKSWGIEAYYPSVESTAVSQMCWAGSEGCGIKKVPKDELTSNHTCESPLAPGRNFCKFERFSYQCYGGVGFWNLPLLPAKYLAPPTIGSDAEAPEVEPTQAPEAGAATWAEALQKLKKSGGKAQDVNITVRKLKNGAKRQA